ncbi:MAG TPA: right-handed parallel beta-helix repeat-containing protein, partial [Candidatus Sumerlaeota bacterium]|nr:right-handed parallel beta-helix repeat-containing protein [Candidatus Sumerlaeota bacterium]
FEVYGDLLEESPATTPDWVAGMAVITGNNKEVVFYLTAKDPKARTDLPAFRTAVRDTLLKNKERGERWLKQFYLDKSYKTWRALASVPFQDRYVFQNFIKASDTFVILQDFPTYVTREEKAQRIVNLRTPDLQVVKASDITPANAGETVKPLPAEVQAVLDKKKAQLDAERKALMAPSELQLKVNAAQPGDTIQLEGKEYVGVVTIDKPLTLEGAEGRATLLSARTFPPVETPQEAGKETTPALLTIKGEGAVVLRNLRFKLEAQDQGSCVILVNQGKARISGCEIEKAPWSGIVIVDADAEIRDCRIGHLGRNGISVRTTPGNRDKTRVLVSGCDFIECVNVGLSIGEGCDNVTVEKCRVSGSSWHGIRYDNASPKIVGNLISKNSRSGIYASGKTKATVKDNVFENNDLSGISCWFNSNDVIEGNTFVGNKREAISSMGYGAPTIRHNIFASNESGISFANSGQGDAQAENEGKPVIEANLFWNNKVDFPYGMNISEKKDTNGRPVYEKPKLDAKSLTS